MVLSFQLTSRWNLPKKHCFFFLFCVNKALLINYNIVHKAIVAFEWKVTNEKERFEIHIQRHKEKVRHERGPFNHIQRQMQVISQVDHRKIMAFLFKPWQSIHFTHYFPESILLFFHLIKAQQLYQNIRHVCFSKIY